MSDLYIRQIEVGPMKNFVYLLGDPQSRLCAVVDPAWQIDTITQAAEEDGYKITLALLTHHHFDHTNGLTELLEKYNIPVYMQKKDAPKIKDVQAHLKPIDGGETIQIGNIPLTFLHTPGHTDGSQCFSIGQNLISGDTLFTNNCGRIDLPDSNPGDMYQSLKKISELPRETTLYPGHNYGSQPSIPLSKCQKENPYLHMTQSFSKEEFLSFIGR